MHHHTIQIDHQPDATIFQFIILTFVYSSTIFGRQARPRTQHDYHHDTKVKPEAATAVIELLMMGGKTPETCWAVNKCQNNKLGNCCIWLVIDLNLIVSRIFLIIASLVAHNDKLTHGLLKTLDTSCRPVPMSYSKKPPTVRQVLQYEIFSTCDVHWCLIVASLLSELNNWILLQMQWNPDLNYSAVEA